MMQNVDLLECHDDLLHLVDLVANMISSGHLFFWNCLSY